MNADGTGQTPIASDPGNSVSYLHPEWSPDGSKIAYAYAGDIYVSEPDGTNQALIAASGANVFEDPAWSPDGTKVAYATCDAAFCTPGDQILVANADGSGAASVHTHTSNLVGLNWQPVRGYPRPKGATPLRISLVTAYQPCTTPNREHGPPTNFGSCSPPQKTSSYLTVGTGDANGKPALNDGYLTVTALVGVPSTPADDADATLEFFSDDVLTNALADYTGELRVSFSVRASDRNNSPYPDAATTQAFPVAFSAPCTASTDPAEGAACALATTVDALIPGAIAEGKRAIWQIDQVRVFDGGADNDGDTTGDNTLFATQGVFVP